MKLVNRKVKFFTVINRVVFHPGLNHLSDSDFKAVINSPAFKSEIDCKNMEISGQIDTETTTAVESTKIKEHSSKVAREILSLKFEETIKQIASLDDPVVLNAIKEIDGRSGIHEAIAKRMVDIDSQKKDDLKSVSISAPEGTGEDFASKIEGKAKDLDGTTTHSAIPALKTVKGK